MNEVFVVQNYQAVECCWTSPFFLGWNCLFWSKFYFYLYVLPRKCFFLQLVNKHLYPYSGFYSVIAGEVCWVCLSGAVLSYSLTQKNSNYRYFVLYVWQTVSLILPKQLNKVLRINGTLCDTYLKQSSCIVHTSLGC